MPRVDQIVRKLSATSRKLLSVAMENHIRKDLPAGGSVGGGNSEFVVFFAEPPAQEYQLQQWLRPFEVLHSRGHGVTLVLMNSFTARSIAQQTTLPILLTRSMQQIEEMVGEQAVRGIFYVNNAQANFTMLRVTGPAHIHLSHGESEKSSMVSNQLKAYDFAFIAGPASRERILDAVPRFDPAHLVQIGRPQLDERDAASTARHGKRISVLYAPTWEGDSSKMAYGSVAGLGRELVERLIADPRFSVVFRPHPKTGTLSVEAAAAVKAIRARITAADRADPGAGNRYDEDPDFVSSISHADVVIADVSAMAMDAIGVGRPLLLATSPTLEQRGTAASASVGLTDVIPVIDAQALEGLTDMVAELAANGVSAEQRGFRDHVFGPEALGAGTNRFIEAALAVTG